MHCHTVVGAVRASAGRQRAPPPPGQKKLCACALAARNFLKSFHSCVKLDGRRTLFSFARPAGKLNFGFIQLALPEQKQSRSLDKDWMIVMC